MCNVDTDKLAVADDEAVEDDEEDDELAVADDELADEEALLWVFVGQLRLSWSRELHRLHLRVGERRLRGERLLASISGNVIMPMLEILTVLVLCFFRTSCKQQNAIAISFLLQPLVGIVE